MLGVSKLEQARKRDGEMNIISLLVGSTVIITLAAFSALAARSEQALRKTCGELDGCPELYDHITMGRGYGR